VYIASVDDGDAVAAFCDECGKEVLAPMATITIGEAITAAVTHQAAEHG
jgi:hypothetical protein